jgi:hypothetical protein
MYIGLHVKYPLFLSDFNQTKLFDRFSKNTQILLHENASVGAELFRVDGQTDEHDEATSRLFVILRPCTKIHSPVEILLWW